MPRQLVLLIIGYAGAIGIASLSDCIIPYLGETILRMPDRHLHLGFIEKWWLINPLAIIGVAIAGRPVARYLDDTYTLEVTRVCVLDNHKNVASMLYAAIWRAARALGYHRVISYILDSEPGTSLVAAGYKVIGQTRGGSWHSNNRPRVDKHPTCQKQLFEKPCQRVKPTTTPPKC